MTDPRPSSCVYHIFDRAGTKDDAVDYCGLSRCMIDVFSDSAETPASGFWRKSASRSSRIAFSSAVSSPGRELPLFHFDRSPHQLLSLGKRELRNRLQDFVQAHFFKSSLARYGRRRKGIRRRKLAAEFSKLRRNDR